MEVAVSDKRLMSCELDVSTTKAAFTPEQNHLLVKLKEGREKLSWFEIHK